ncbi:MAG: hypothetical protein D6702_00955 [Planctomycetota bacterium]|nr:MAG: hypothetical protein D6702_00955 [Planctomycetota bacterium]
MWFSYLLLFGLIKLLERIADVKLCVGIYTGAGVLFDLFEEMTLVERLVSPVIDLGLSWLLFSLLLRFEANRSLWWTTLIGFLCLPFLLALAGL